MPKLAPATSGSRLAGTPASPVKTSRRVGTGGRAASRTNDDLEDDPLCLTAAALDWVQRDTNASTDIAGGLARLLRTHDRRNCGFASELADLRAQPPCRAPGRAACAVRRPSRASCGRLPL